MSSTPSQPPTGDERSPGADTPSPWTGRTSLDRRWWWSATIMIVAGLGVIAYQVAAYRGEGGGMWLNAVMIVVGAAVAGWGLVQLRQDYASHRDRSEP